MPSLAGLRILVVGLGRFGGGVGVTQWLVRQGASVTVTDQADAASLADSLQDIAGLPVTLCLGGHERCDLSQTDLAVINPAVLKSTSALFQEILRRKIPWTTEINLFCERCPAPVIGVTGSFGKSTTCAMLAHALEIARQSGQAPFTGVHLGGNIGRSLLGDLTQIRPTDIVVLEISNAQLEDIGLIKWEPAIAVITNLHRHHLDRYPSYEDYIRAKLNLVRAGDGVCPVIHGEMDEVADKMLHDEVRENPARLVRVMSWKDPLELRVPGQHNLVNAACVSTVCDVIGIHDVVVRDALTSFRGLPHRLEVVGEIGGVTYINDSKSTAPPATIIALEALCEKWGAIIAIVGGQKKTADFGPCAKSLVQACRMVVCYGEAGPAFAKAIMEANVAPPTSETGPTELLRAKGVEEAVEMAASLGRPGDTVLFSPGAPSFDQYVNFTERGKHFCRLIQALGQLTPP